MFVDVFPPSIINTKAVNNFVYFNDFVYAKHFILAGI